MVALVRCFRSMFFIAVFIGVVLSLTFFRITITTHGTIAWQDLKAPGDCNRFIRFMWDPVLQEHIIANHLIFELPLSILGPQVAPRIIIVVLFFISYISMYILVLRLTHNFLLSLIISLIYTYNPITAIRIGHTALMIMYSFTPLAVYVLMKIFDMIEQNTSLILPHIILLAFVLFIMSSSVRIILWTQPLIAMWIAYLLTCNNKKFFIYKSLKLASILVLIYVALNTLWLLPMIMQILREGTIALQAQKVTHYILNYEEIDLLSMHALLPNVFSLTSYWMNKYGLEYVYDGLLPLVRTCITLLVLFLPLPLLIARSKNRRIFASVILIFTIITWFFAKGSNPPLKSFYYWFVFNTPLSNIIGWMFRGPNKWNLLLPFYYCLLLALALDELPNCIKSKWAGKILLLLLLVVSLPIISPFISGDLNGALKPVAVGSIPLNHDKAIIIYKENPNTNTQLKTLCTPSYYKETWLRLFIAEFSRDKDMVAYLLSNIGIKYLVEIKGCNLNLYDIHEVKQLYSPRYIMFLTDYQKTVSVVNALNSTALILPIVKMENLHTMSESDYILNTNFESFLLSNFRQYKSIVISPYNNALHYRPYEYWSRASTTDPLHGEWHPYLSRSNIENWQFDYGFGLVFTWAKLRIPSLRLSAGDLVEHWEFSRQVDCASWGKYTSVKQFGALQTLSCIDGALVIRLYNSTWGWKVVKSPLIPMNPDHAYRFIIRIRGIHSHKVHVKVAEFDVDGKLIDVKYVKGIGDGTFDWKDVVFNYVPSSDRVRFVQLQVWHGHLTDKPLPNIIIIDYVRVYDVTKYAKRVTLNMPFEVSKSGTYKLFVRYFENQKGGTIRVYLDGSLIASVKTVSQLNKFVWRDLGAFKLEAGRHTLTLENVEGFNAVNVFVLIPVDEYSKLVKKVEELLENKTVIYLFEAESDMFRSKAKVVQNISASDGEMLYLEPGGSAWQSFDVVKSGYYMVAVKLRGSASVVIDGKRFNVSSDSLRFHYIGPLRFARGNHTLRVEALQRPLYLDVVWIYSVKSPNSKVTIQDLFKVKEELAKVIDYERINPTLWRAKVYARKPFMLVFAEAYDPLWEARVYRGSELVESVRSIPVYGVINGFWINATGNLTVVIRYVPQDWFELGLKISATTFALCIFYLVWGWRIGKGDKWALTLRKALRDCIRKALKRGISNTDAEGSG